ncbi:MAG: DUF4097 domain-containing protein [Ruminococcaceae bacterium]|nr:DUF4097 domain-containing protein [Oscillospiraceae bacterium]
MKKGLIVFLVILAVAAAAFVAVMVALNWDFTKLSTVEYETNRYELTDGFRSISILTDVADVTFVKSDNASVECYEIRNMKHQVAVENDTLVVRVNDTRKWYEHIGIFFGAPKITVNIPGAQYEQLAVETDTGDITASKDFSFLEIRMKSDTGSVHTESSATGRIKLTTSTGHIFAGNLSAGSLEITSSTGNQKVENVTVTEDVENEVSTGKTTLKNITCRNLTADGDTGDLALRNVLAAGRFELERSTGDITFDKCDAGELFVETDTGNVKGTLLSEKIFLTETDTGKIDVPKSVTGGRCEISTDTGNIAISISR